MSDFSDVESQLIACAKSMNRCEVADSYGRKRLIEFYMVYQTSKGKKCLHFYQIQGYSESGEPTGWKNPESSSIVSVTPLSEKFVIHRDYNPHNRTMFARVFFSLPSKDGRVRA